MSDTWMAIYTVCDRCGTQIRAWTGPELRQVTAMHMAESHPETAVPSPPQGTAPGRTARADGG
jgi:hypothetical protein